MHLYLDRVSRAAAKKGMAASRIFHSDKLRAKETAEILARNIIPSEGICEINGLGPEDDPSLTKAEIEASGKSLIVVGHLPHLNRLATMLLNGHSGAQVLDFPTASVVCLSRRKKKWKVNWTLAPAGA
jgi:phosphohistidine phosphatase